MKAGGVGTGCPILAAPLPSCLLAHLPPNSWSWERLSRLRKGLDKSWTAEMVGREMDREVLEGTGSSPLRSLL